MDSLSTAISGHTLAATNLAMTNLAMTSLAMTSLAMTDLAATNLPATSLAMTDLPATNLAATNLATPNLAAPNLATPNLATPSLAMTGLGALHAAARRGWTTMPARPGQIPQRLSDRIDFDRFSLLPAQRLLLEDDTPVRLGARALDILIALAARIGEVVTKEALIAQVWPNAFVEAGSLRVHMVALRKALRDSDGRLIRTVPGQGYQLAAQVPRTAKPSSPPPSATAPMQPLAATRIIGRSDFIDDVVAQLPLRRLMTITGPGGIGKTTVALACAAALAGSYPEGVAFVDLAPVARSASVAVELAEVLGIAISSEHPIDDLMPHLRKRQMLLVIDNCEHVIDSASALTEAISTGAPGVHILATSREALRVWGEWVRCLPPLPSPPAMDDLTAAEALTYPAVQLFVERAGAVEKTFQLGDADAPAVGEICRRLDGVALAIELAAAKVDTFGLAWLAAHLDDRLRILNRGRRTAAVRHQTLAAMLDWSYDLLSEQERTALQRLANFTGEFSLAAAIAVAGGSGICDLQVTDAVAGLVAKSLATVDTSGSVASYRLPETTRAYACAKANIAFRIIAQATPD